MDAAKNQYLSEVIVAPEATIAEALAQLDKAGTGALAVCLPDNSLIGMICDGDIRRGLLAGPDLHGSCCQIVNREPFFVRQGVAPLDALKQMRQKQIDQLPVLDDDGRLVDLLLRKNLIAEAQESEIKRWWLDRLIIQPETSIQTAIQQLDDVGTGALAVCREDRTLEALLTDGDIRRAVLRSISLDAPCGQIATRDPMTVDHPISDQDALKIMMDADINQLPVVDERNELRDFLLRRELAHDSALDMSAVIMAGGFGKRLMPLTEQVPKPMLPVGDKPLLERTVDRLKKAGVSNVHMTTHYLPEHITGHFGDGEKFGVQVDYSQEDHPMGTAGGLRLFPRPEKPFVVLNGDILTGVSFEEMYKFHQANKALMTVGVRKYEIKVPYGVVKCEDVQITELQEKPAMDFFINAGIYLLAPEAYDRIPEGERFDMTDLIEKLLQEGEKVVSFPILEYWLDIGQHDDYKKAQEDCRSGKI